MTLKDLEKYNPITIQCHDNPDADALASGYGLYCYFKEKGNDVRLVYSGINQIQKSNLKLMVEELHLPIEYVKVPYGSIMPLEGLLITVDCQFGAGNVTGLVAEEVAIIDHHQVEIENVPLNRISPNLGSCATLVWKLLQDEGFDTSAAEGLDTALYYGLYTDTNQFSELYNPLDMDMREDLVIDKSLITLFRNSNLSLNELQVAGIAMLRYSYNEDYGFAVIKAQPCDPNILGLISDFLLQVDVIKACVVFNENGDGYKISVRSCTREVNASELVGFLTEGIGSGGGHYEKAGGFISMKLYEERYPAFHAETYFNLKMTKYFESYEVIYAENYQVDVTDMKLYSHRRVPMGYVKSDEVLPVGSPITIRTLEGDIELTVETDLYLIIGIKGEVTPIRREEFEKSYLILNQKYSYDQYITRTEYVPTIKDRDSGETLVLADYAGVCVPTGEVKIYAKPLEKGVKVFTAWDKNKYMLGKPGDYVAVRCGNLNDVSVVEKKIFHISYAEVES